LGAVQQQMDKAASTDATENMLRLLPPAKSCVYSSSLGSMRWPRAARATRSTKRNSAQS
jgi:hypothetical protein